MADDTTTKELNRLYWETDASVSEIADRLDISRRALYDGIEPRPAGMPCPECGAPLGFRNRTALENREAECPECGHETEVGLAAWEEAPEETRQAAPSPEPLPRRSVPRAGAAPLAGGAFLTGLAVGALVTYVFHRR